ncbi:DcrB family lipoprotein [Erwinia tracheiphila]|uniref:Inner membrane lipoprotein DcrB n=1 Tax=Erwinia tracheiphila TaxID=65700 RepID=A0A0M2KC07_9GAMM|nr:DcrB family lipoprotein [Erwinia tracheiphila]AXF78566.1 DUF1795 domain-containing protein [Erwinia tracheiphila]EOS93666.1 hypothetical protein ETR_17946 [Erwinia tracheiphila PSU-1]KKF36469.1 hypothetical protein SY86_15140 [Erwinia tracheiphila]UIA85779.1 DcrB family lipoprotein [Erwinia tracheiphila]UIA90205.1 DcrB family lipoprotein [Erwinia tracheiphila]
MRNLLRYAGIGLLVVGLSACDGQKDNAAADSNSPGNSQTVTLVNGKMSFSLPSGMSDQSGKLGTQTNNMHVYADATGQRAIIVIEGNATSEALDALSKRLEAQQRSRDPQLQVVTNKPVELKGQPAQQLDSVISAKNQSTWSSVVLAKVDNRLMTLQITLPADNQQQSQTDAENIIKTITFK